MDNLKNEQIKFLDYVYEVFETMRSKEINLVYEGEITHEITKAFASLTESNMESQQENSSVQRKVFHVMVECLQNISKHADTYEDIYASKDGRGIFIVHKSDNKYSITTGNVISQDKIPGLKKLLDHINSLDKDGLKQLHKKQIKEGRLSEKKGAGLGFIDIARKTGNKLIYNFKELNDKNSFFILTSTILRNN